MIVLDKAKSIRNDIQVLRAVAVLLVVVTHFSTTLGDGYNFFNAKYMEFFGGGLVGVNIFFVVSGFIITSMLLREQVVKGSISLKNFYGRRIKRIMPVATLVVILILVLNLVLRQSDFYSILIQTSLAMLSVMNWYYTLNEIPPGSTVGHYWSLSVEEQFYFVWPVFIIAAVLLYKKFGYKLKTVLNACLSFIVVSSLAYHLVFAVDNPKLYQSTFNHVWELAVGALVAVNFEYFKKLSTILSRLFVYVGFVLIAYIIIFTDNVGGHLTSPLWSLPAVVGTAMIIVGGNSGVGGWLLNNKSMIWVGNISFSLYLWHELFLLGWMHVKGTFIGNMIVDGLYLASFTIYEIVTLFALSVFTAWLSTKYFENPIRSSALFKDDVIFNKFGLAKYNIPNTYILGLGLLLFFGLALVLSYSLVEVL